MAAKERIIGGAVLYWQDARNIVNEQDVGGNPIRYTVRYNWRRFRWNTLPGWKTQLEVNGFLPTLSMTDEQRVCRDRLTLGTPLKFRLKSNPRNGTNIVGPYVPIAYNVGDFLAVAADPNALIDAKNKALNKAKQMRINLAVTVAEGKNTFRMLYNTVRTLGESYGHFRKGRWKSASRRLGIDAPSRSAANNWLAYQLGWLPLISDAVGLIELHRDQFSTARDNLFIVRGATTIVKPSQGVFLNHLVSGNHSVINRLDVTTGRAGMLLKVTSKLDQFQASVGLSASDILSTLWELVPYSFVMDYFINVGQWLGNLSALSGLQVLDAWQITESSRTTNLVCSAAPTSLYTSNVPEQFMNDRYVTRSSWNPGSVTWPRVRSITDQSAIRMITMAALFRNQFTGDPKLGKFRPSLTE